MLTYYKLNQLLLGLPWPYFTGYYYVNELLSDNCEVEAAAFLVSSSTSLDIRTAFSKAEEDFKDWLISCSISRSLYRAVYSNYFLSASFSRTIYFFYLVICSSICDFSSWCWRCNCLISFSFWSSSSWMRAFRSVTDWQRRVNSEWYFLWTSCLTQSRMRLISSF